MGALILVVDDLLPNRRLLEAKLKSEYYDVISADSGIKALEMASESRPDVILLDVMMPEMDGFETCRRLKKNPRTAEIPVVMVTALSDAEDRVEGLTSGADDFLTKPINDLALFARIRSLVRLKSMTDELKLRDKTGAQIGSEAIEERVIDTTNARILIIDDDVVQAQQICLKLQEVDNMDVSIIADPATAVKASEKNDFDLIMVSTQLTADDGLHLCMHLRSQERTRNTPLLIIIEEGNTDLLIKALDMGINDYLISPIDGNEVIARARIQVRRKRYQSALQENQKESLEMAVKDGLTRLYNRRYFDIHVERMLQSALETAKPLALMIIDMDHFKSVNDTHGHLSGDEILKQLAELITKNVRPTDLVARYGGEEFVVVMPNTTLNQSATVAERIRRVIEKTEFRIPVDPGILRKTLSIGLSMSAAGDTVHSLMERADKGLYHVKKTGRNKVAVFSDKKNS